MSSELLTELDSNFSNFETGIQYPHITVNAKNTQALPLVLELMDKGNLPVYFTQDSETFELAKISGDPLNLNRLLKVYTFNLIKSATEQTLINNTKSLMEASIWMQSLS